MLLARYRGNLPKASDFFYTIKRLLLKMSKPDLASTLAIALITTLAFVLRLTFL